MGELRTEQREDQATEKLRQRRKPQSHPTRLGEGSPQSQWRSLPARKATASSARSLSGSPPGPLLSAPTPLMDLPTPLTGLAHPAAPQDG